MRARWGNWPGILGIFAIFGATAFLLTPDVNADSFDWRNVNGVNWVTSVKNQGSAGTCWDFAGCGILEAKYMLTRDDTTYQPDVSEQQLLCAGVGSISGGNAYNVDDYAVSTGVVLESELPYTQQNTSPLWPLASGWQNRVFKASSDYTMFSQGTSLSYLKACLKTYGPLTIQCVVPQDWYNLQDSSGSGNHEVVIVGYQDNSNAPGGGYWIVKNSWGSWWNGDGNHNGYGEIAYASEPSYSDWSWLWIYNHDVTGLTGNVCFTGPMATVTWNGGSGVWSLGGSSWSGTDMYGNSLPSYAWNNSEALATFNPSGATNITISGPVVAHGVIIASGATGYVFNGSNGGVLTTTGSGIVAHESATFNVDVKIGAPQSWTIDAGKSLVIGGSLHTIISPLTLNGDGDTTIAGNINGGGVLNSMGDAPGSITKNGEGTLHLTGAATYSVPLTLSSGYLSFEQNGSNIGNYTGVISGGGSGWVSKSGTGTIILSGANTYNCWTRLYNGVVQADLGTGLPSQSSLILNGGVFQSNSTTTYTDKFRNEVSGTNRWLSWWDGGFAGGAGTLTVNLRGNGSAVDWTGNGDTGIGNSMKFNSPTAQNPVIFQNGLNLDGAVRAIYVDNNPNNFNNYAIMSGVISNGAGGTASGLVKNGPGRLVLTGVNTYGDGAGYDNGATQINQGVLQADWGVGYSSNSGLILNGGVLQSNSAVTFTNRMWYDGWNDSVTWYSGGFSAGGGKMTVNLYGDDRTISFGTDPRGSIAGTMILSSNSAQYETEFQNGLNLNGGARTIEVDDNPNSSGDFASLSGVISDSVGGGSWTKTGIGTLYIKGTASNTYTGATTFTGGTIYLSKTGGAVAIPGNLNIADGAGRTYVVLGGNNEIAPSAVFSSVTPIYWGDLELNGYQQTLAGISSDAWATISNGGNTDSTLTVNNSGNYTFAGRLVNNINSASGKLVLVKTGSGTLNLSGTNTYTGATTISGGTLQLGSASALGNTAGVTVNSGAASTCMAKFLRPPLP